MSGDDSWIIPAIILYDGECGFCTKSVLFVFHRDPRERYHFAPLRSETGRRLLAAHGIPPSEDTVVLIDGSAAFVRSTAALRIARGLRWPWSWLGAVGFGVPRTWRDAAYRAFAKRRHRAWGTTNHCAMPSEQLRRRLIE